MPCRHIERWRGSPHVSSVMHKEEIKPEQCSQRGDAHESKWGAVCMACYSCCCRCVIVMIQHPFFIFHPLPKSFPLRHPHQSLSQHVHNKHQFDASPLPASPCCPHHRLWIYVHPVHPVLPSLMSYPSQTSPTLQMLICIYCSP